MILHGVSRNGENIFTNSKMSKLGLDVKMSTEVLLNWCQNFQVNNNYVFCLHCHIAKSLRNYHIFIQTDMYGFFLNPYFYNFLCQQNLSPVLQKIYLVSNWVHVILEIIVWSVHSFMHWLFFHVVDHTLFFFPPILVQFISILRTDCLVFACKALSKLECSLSCQVRNSSSCEWSTAFFMKLLSSSLYPGATYAFDKQPKAVDLQTCLMLSIGPGIVGALTHVTCVATSACVETLSKFGYSLGRQLMGVGSFQ